MSTQFSKVGSKVRIASNNAEHFINSSANIKMDPRNENIIVISEETNPQEELDGVRINVRDVTGITFTDRADLMAQLAANYFTTSTSVEIAGFATEAKQDVQTNIFNNILTAVTNNKSFEETVWIDDNNVYFVRRVTMVAGIPTISYQHADGSSYVPVGVPRLAISNPDLEPLTAMYKATVAGAGYSINDYVNMVSFINASINPPVLVSQFWVNLNTGINIATPNMAHLVNVEFTEATETTQLLIKAKTDNLDLSVTALRDALRGVNSNTLSDIIIKLTDLITTNGIKKITDPVTISNTFGLEATQVLIKAKTDNLDLAITALRDALRGGNNNTLSDVIIKLTDIISTNGIKKITDLVAVREKSAYQYFYTNAVNTTVTKKTGAGTLHKIINCDNVGSITIYDNTTATGTPLANIDCTKIFGSLSFNIDFATGLTIVIAGGAKVGISYE